MGRGPDRGLAGALPLGRHKAKESALRAARAAYGRIERSPAAPLLRMRVVEQARQRLHRRMHATEVLDVLDELKASGLEAWVAGGWGVDALVGAQTRQHDDLDLIVDIAYERDAQAVLAVRGFRHVRSERFRGALMPKQIILRDRAGRVVDLHGVDARTWPASWREQLESVGRSTFPFDAARPFAAGRIAGRPVECLSPELQLASRQGYALTDSSIADARVLCARFGLAEPDYLRAAR